MTWLPCLSNNLLLMDDIIYPFCSFKIFLLLLLKELHKRGILVCSAFDMMNSKSQFRLSLTGIDLVPISFFMVSNSVLIALFSILYSWSAIFILSGLVFETGAFGLSGSDSSLLIF